MAGSTHRPKAWWHMGMLVLLYGVLSRALVSAEGIAVLKSHDLEPFDQAVAGFTAACAMPTTTYTLQGTKKYEGSIVQRLTATNPQVIVAIGPLAAQVATERLPHIPVVFVMVSNPPKYGLQGRNLAGVSLDIPVQAQLAMAKSLVPALRRLGVLYDPEKTGGMVFEARSLADALGFELLASPVSSQKEVPAAFRALLGKIQAFWMVPDETVVTPESFKFLLLTAFDNNLPFVAVSDIFVEAGALASLSPDYADVGRQGCQLVTDIQNGRQPADVMIVPPAKVQLTLNLKTASKIGLTLSPEVIRSANKVYR